MRWEDELVWLSVAVSVTLTMAIANTDMESDMFCSSCSGANTELFSSVTVDDVEERVLVNGSSITTPETGSEQKGFSETVHDVTLVGF